MTEKEMNDKVKELVDLIGNVNNQVEALNNAIPIIEPSPYAGNLLVDPVIVAALDFHWRELTKLTPDLALMTNITGKHRYGKYLSQVTVIPLLAEALKGANNG